MEKHEFVFYRSLQQMAMIKVAINVWNEAENLNLLNQVDYENLIFPKKVKEKVSLYILPKEIKQELLKTLDPIAIQILKWKKRHATVLLDPGCFLNKLCWTSIGTVDNRKTAKNLLQQELIDISHSYQLACMYCLENDIPLIWKKLPEDDKKHFCGRSETLNLEDRLVAIWSKKLELEENKPRGFGRLSNVGTRFSCSNLKYAFEAAVASANKEAADYFLQKLTPGDRRASLLLSPDVFNTWACECTDNNLHKKLINFNDIIVYLLSQMNEEEQMAMFQFGVSPTMISFLEWPWHVLFKKVAELSLKHYSFENYKVVLKNLIKGREICGYFFPKLLEDFLQVSPCDLKHQFISMSDKWSSYFFNSYYPNCINIILRNLKYSSRNRESFIDSTLGLKHCINLMDDGKWSLLELFIAHCALSENGKAKVKKNYMNTHWYHMNNILARHNKGRDWTRFFHLIDNASVEDCRKRKLEDIEAGEWCRKRLK